MIKRNFYRTLQTLKLELNENQIKNIKNTCELLSETAKNTQNFSYSFFHDNQQAQTSRNEFIRKISQGITNEKNSINFRLLIVDCHKANIEIQGFIEACKYNDQLKKSLEDLASTLDAFLDEYDKYRLNSQPEIFYKLSFISLQLANKIINIEKLIDILLWSNDSDGVENELTSLDLYLTNVNSLTSFGKKLEAVEVIYTEICNLLNVSVIDNPIIIHHIESGSLWLKIAGHTLTATILTAILNSASSYYQENFTKTGQLQQLPGTVTAINELLKISDELNKQGIDTKEINDHLNSATKKIAKKLDILLSDQPTIEVNDKIHNIGEAYKHQLIEQSKTKLLTHNDESL
ncbi:hypothetical protein [uncultured Tolumonas sp.]|uniref:hypothetical protein n=1 Tax=uncultured Tolumonas sp. TaxID=263765 RepID=UPI00292CCB7B|nr:hypothetical protein [uncultured Tolumonas sp.]